MADANDHYEVTVISHQSVCFAPSAARRISQKKFEPRRNDVVDPLCFAPADRVARVGRAARVFARRGVA